MATNVTHGYDFIVQVNEVFVNQMASDLDLRMDITPPDLPGECTAEIRGEGYAEAVTVGFSPGTCANCLDLTVDFIINFDLLRVTCGIFEFERENFSINLIIHITQPVTVYTDAIGRDNIGLDFTTGIEQLTLEMVGLDDSDAINEVMETVIAGAVEERMAQEQIAFFTPPADMEDCPFQIREMEARMVNDDCLAFLFTMVSETPGDPALIEDHLPDDGNTALIVGNEFLLGHLIIPRFMEEFDLSGSVEDLFTQSDGRSRYTLAGSHSIDLDSLDMGSVEGCDTSSFEDMEIDGSWLDALAVFIDDGSIGVEGTLRFHKTGVTFWADFGFQVAVAMGDDGAIQTTVTMNEPEVRHDVEWWVWLLMGFGITLLPFVTVIVTVVIARMIDRAEEAIACILSSLPLPDLDMCSLTPGEFTIDRVVVDDFFCLGRTTLPERPVAGPELFIENDWEVIDSEATDSDFRQPFREPAYVITVDLDLTHHGRFHAGTRRLTYPVEFQWCLAGHVLTGEGTVDISGTEVSYEVDHDRCELWTEPGGSLACELCVSAVDSRAIELFVCETVDIQGKTTIGGKVGADIAMGPLPELITAAPAFDLGDVMATRGRDTISAQFSMAISKGMGIEVAEEEFHF